MAEIKDYSVTADDNDSASPNGMPENMSPSGVNNAWRESFARVKRWYEDIQGAKTTTGSSNAYVLAAARTVTAYAAGDASFMFKANHTCTAAGSTLNVDSVGAKSIVTPAGAALGAGDITSGGIYIVAYEASADKFMLLAGSSTFSGDITAKTSDGAILNLQTSDTTVTSGSVLGRTDYQAPNEASGTDAILLAASIAAIATDTFAADNNSCKLSFMTAASAAAAETMSLSSGGNLTLPTDGVVIATGADSDVTLTHVADSGLTLKNTSTGADTPFVLLLQTGETDIVNTDTLGKIQFQAPDESSGTDAILVAAEIAAVATDTFATDNNATKLSFKTGSSGAASEKMSLNSGGNLAINSDGSTISMGTSGEILITHVEDVGLNLKNTNTGDDKPFVLKLQTGETDIVNTDVLGKIQFQAPDESGGTDAILVAAEIAAVATDTFAADNNATKLSFKTGSSGAASEKMSLNAGGNLALNADGCTFSMGTSGEILYTHVHDVGINLKNTNTGDDKPFVLKLQTGEEDIAAADVLGKIEFQAPDETTGTDANLVAGAIDCVSEGDFSSSSNASKLSFRTGASETATEKMSLSSAGKLTVTGGSALGDAAGDAHTLTGTYAVNSNNVAVGNRMIFTSTGTFTKADDVPAHVLNVTVHCIGGGGGGGGGDTDTGKRGTGGGGGGYTMERLALSALSADETVTVGAAGASGATQSSPTAGGAGGTSSFGSHCSATGGSAGSAATGAAMGGSSGGAGSGGDLNATGGSSYVQHDGSHVSFGGNAAGPWGGGVAASNVATAGNAYGGGASNLNHVTSTAAGAAGLVVVEW